MAPQSYILAKSSRKYLTILFKNKYLNILIILKCLPKQKVLLGEENDKSLSETELEQR